MQLNRVEIIGAGPAGLYASILLKEAMPLAQVCVREQNPRDATFGFGVVFSDKALSFLAADDPKTHELITPHMQRWENMTLVHQGREVTLDGIGFASIARLHLLQILQTRAEKLGVEMIFNARVDSAYESDADLVIGADGFNSLVRQKMPEAFQTTVDTFTNHFAWFGVEKPFDTLTQTFVKSEHGAMNAHHYRYSENMSTFIVECDNATFKAERFGTMNEEQSAKKCETVFADVLEGAPLINNNSVWRQFPKLWCNRWVSGNTVILGDAAHTAHFSIGSGTRLALEDTISLIKCLVENVDLPTALAEFENTRMPIAKKIVDAANTSALWYEAFASKMVLDPIDFAYNYVTRSKRVDINRLRQLSPQFAASYEAHVIAQAT